MSSDVVHWELTALGANGSGPYALVVRHPHGTVLEYFKTTPLALTRLSELDGLLAAAGHLRPSSGGPPQ